MAHYVNNADLLKALIEYRTKKAEAAADGKSKPLVSDYIGECILKIATRLSHKPNFINYSYREDMILDGVENCIQYIDNFNPERSSNPFAYFTQIIYYAFLRRIAKEKKQSYIKGKLIQDMPFDMFETQEHDDDKEFHNQYMEFMQQNYQVDDFIARKKANRKKKAQVDLDDFLGDKNDDLDTKND
jgi:DNA-directed RNA polymerase specialized sigma24 family protein